MSVGAVKPTFLNLLHNQWYRLPGLGKRLLIISSTEELDGMSEVF